MTGLYAVPKSQGEGPPGGASAPAMAGTDGPEVEAGAASRVIFFSDAVVATLYVVIQVIASGCLVLMSRAAVCGGLLQPDAPRGGPPPG